MPQYEYTMFVDMESIRSFECEQSPEELRELCKSKPEVFNALITAVVGAMISEQVVDITHAEIVTGEVNHEADGNLVGIGGNLLYDEGRVIDRELLARKVQEELDKKAAEETE